MSDRCPLGYLFLGCEELVPNFNICEESVNNFYHTYEESVPNPHACEELAPNLYA